MMRSDSYWYKHSITLRFDVVTDDPEPPVLDVGLMKTIASEGGIIYDADTVPEYDDEGENEAKREAMEE